MKSLYICTTTNMLMAVIQIRRFIEVNENADILITDQSGIMSEVYNNLSRIGLFENIYFFKCKKKYEGGNIFYKIRKFFYIFESKRKILKETGLKNLDYDLIYFCNFDLLTNQIFYNIYKNNKYVLFNRVEEGFSTYTRRNVYITLEKLTDVLYKICRMPSLKSFVKKLYLYEPELLLYNCEYEKIKIPKYRKCKDDVRLLNTVFGYTDEASEYQKYKYIIFEESFYHDNKEKINDEEVFRTIVSRVGKDNVIIKLHPRNTKNRFSDLNVGRSNIPWEIIQLNGDFNNNIFITISSGSVLASKIWLCDDVKTFFLYKCTNVIPNIVDRNYLSYFDIVNKRINNESWIVPDNIDDALKKMISI